MKRFSKLIALALLLAVVVSAFGIFSAFAEEVNTSALSPTVIYDMNNEADNKAFTNKVTVDDKTAPSLSTLRDENNEKYWLIESNVTKDYKHLSSAGPYLQITPTSNPVIRSGGTKGNKDTDFIVVDLDVATDSTFYSGLYFHTRFGDINESTSQNDAGYIRLNGAGNDSFFLDSYGSTSTTYDLESIVELTDKWIGVTLVYDYRTEDTANWACHAYIDGYYVGDLPICRIDDSVTDTNKKSAYYWMWYRFSVPLQAAHDYESTMIRNLTVTQFPVDWDGDLNANAFDKYNHLSSFNELAYCFEDTNTPLDVTLATIIRGGDTENPIYIKSFEDLDAGFVDGDIVTINQNIDTPIFVNAANVTIASELKDDGVTPKYDFSTVDLTEADYDPATAKYVVLNKLTRAYVSSGDATAFNSLSLKSSGRVCILLDDITRSTASSTVYNYTIDLNGHTMILDATASSKRFFAVGADYHLTIKNGTLQLGNTYSASDFAMPSASTAMIMFDNMDEIISQKANTFLDHRGGTVVFKDIAKLSNPQKKTLINSKGNGSNKTGLILDGFNYEGSVSPFSLSNTSSSVSKQNSDSATKSIGQRQGGLNTRIVCLDSNITLTGSSTVFDYTAYPNQTGIYIDEDGNLTVSHVDYAANKFVLVADIVNSDISTSYRIFDLSLYSLTYNYAISTYPLYDTDGDGTAETAGWVVLPSDNLYKANGLSIDADINFRGGEIACSSLVYQNKATSTTALGVPYTFDVAVEVGNNAKINNTNGVMWSTISADTDINVANMYLTLNEGVLLTNSKTARTDNDCAALDSLILGEGTSSIAHTGLYGTYKYIVTANYTNNNYYKGTAESGYFFWNDADGDTVDMTRITDALASSDLYTYTWETEDKVGVNGKFYYATLAPNFKPSVSLSTNGYLALNVFVPDGVAIKDGAYAVENGVSLGQYGDTATYNMAKIEAIDPTDANVNYEVDVVITGAYGDTLEKAVNVSVIKYAASVLTNYADENSAENKYAVALLGYIKSVMEYADADYTEALAAIATVLGDKTAATATKPDAVDNKGSANGVTSYAMNLGGSINWVITAEAGATYTVKVGDGNAVVRTADEEGKLYISVRAYEVFETVTVSDGENTLTFNISNYYNEPTTTSDAKVVVDALAAYAEAAVAYKAQLDAAN